jgi:hypothetical protein
VEAKALFVECSAKTATHRWPTLALAFRLWPHASLVNLFIQRLFILYFPFGPARKAESKTNGKALPWTLVSPH